MSEAVVFGTQTSGVLTLVLVPKLCSRWLLLEKLTSCWETSSQFSEAATFPSTRTILAVRMLTIQHSIQTVKNQSETWRGDFKTNTGFQRIRQQICRTSVLLDNVLKRQFTVGQESWWLLLCCLEARWGSVLVSLVNSNNVLAPSAWQKRSRLRGKRYSLYCLSFKWLNSGNWIIANRSSYASKTPDRHVNMSFWIDRLTADLVCTPPVRREEDKQIGFWETLLKPLGRALIPRSSSFRIESYPETYGPSSLQPSKARMGDWERRPSSFSPHLSSPGSSREGESAMVTGCKAH